MTNVGPKICNCCYCVLTFHCDFRRDILDELHQRHPILKGDNYGEWKKKIDLAFICGEVNLVVTEPYPTKPEAQVRKEHEDAAAWWNKERNYAPLMISFDKQHKKWTNANKKCMAVTKKNTIEPSIVGWIVWLHLRVPWKNKETTHWFFTDICNPITFLHYIETWLVFHVWTKMVMIVILEMANVIFPS